MKSGVEFHSRVFNLKGDTLYLRDTSMLINDIEQIAYCYRNHDEVIAADVAFGVGAIFATVYVHNFFYNEDWLNSEKAPYVAVMGNGIIVMAIAMLVINIHSFKKTYFDLTEKWKLKSNKSGS
jgi:hypothetical protein